MNNFDLKKFLTENKLTTASKLVTEAFGEKEEWGATDYGDNLGLEIKSLAKQLYLGFKKMGARVRLDANRKKSPMGAEWGEKGLDQMDVLIWVREDAAHIDLIGDKAMSFADKIMKDPKFSKFEFNKREIKTWENQKGIEITIKPKVSRKGAVSVTEALNKE